MARATQLLHQIRERIRYTQSSNLHTEQAYVQWVRMLM